ncbi:type II toxin-antitoxin system HipA family toxin [Pedobacter flavus]|uniref:Type II toxin-antitoxin system HipA family toxin n=1 Tax=Pedobacter flavus TaxID=3113906 RepID=A0ABU7H2B8_9SPHI|nr:type II toxin-antitoxin system HipA family toxin [Pedobacter sp. VNH31]MEE1885444.1 type II toxin-antitoxin system HipA family toxin [Pedobacter sp. VNH31]
MNSAFINIWNKRVGAVMWDEEKKLAYFEYDKKFLKQGVSLSPIFLPNNQPNKVFYFPELAKSSTYKGLPGMLADLLPDKYGNTLINAWLARNGRPANSMNPVEMLCFVGNRGMGALEFEPTSTNNENESTAIEIEGLIEIASDILNERQDFSTKIAGDKEKALLDIIKIGTSAGGARAKALIAYNPITNEVRSGQTIAPAGFSHWILKFDGVHDTQFGESYGFGRVEMAYALMAKDCGIEMTECKLLEENGRAHFMTKRFDRINNDEKIHMQSWCALSHVDFQEIGAHSYESLFQTMRTLLLPYPDAEQMFRRMVFNIIGRNCDDHTKNFAFLMDKKGDWRLSPAFDVCYAYRPDSFWVSKQSITANGKRDHFTEEDLLKIANQMNIKKAKQIIDEVQNTINNWRVFAKEVNVNEKLIQEIDQNLLKIV